MNKRTLFVLLSICFTAFVAFAQTPFDVDAKAVTADGKTVVAVSVQVPEEHFIYAESFGVWLGEDALAPLTPLPTARKDDPFSDEVKDVLADSFTARYAWPRDEDSSVRIEVRYQGCSASVCFFPQRVPFDLSRETAASSPAVLFRGPSADDPVLEQLLPGLAVADTAGGYLKPPEFIRFLNRARGLETGAEKGWLKLLSDPVATYESLGLWPTLLLILIGGVLLNLTPCVLPMIPVNLAIIGAGAQAGSRTRGFLLGGLYGVGMALAYGLLGLIVVLTGSQFGTLNASPWFNGGIAVLFVLLGLAMFGVFHIDFSRFQGHPSGGSSGGGSSWPLVFGMGVVAALLAGACVAPVLIFVLVLAQNFYVQGIDAGLALPFVLGVGMALPWPFAGAGLSFLPKPGGWMNIVKYAFGVLILAMAVYYGFLAYETASARTAEAPVAAEAEPYAIAVTPETAAEKLPEIAAMANAQGRYVLIDFWATWCKNCLAMEKTTFKDEDVQAVFDEMIVVKYQAERVSDAPTAGLLKALGAHGLPAYAVFAP